jgi:hypothetical protein
VRKVINILMNIKDIFESSGNLGAWVHVMSLDQEKRTRVLSAFNKLAEDQRGDPEIMIGTESNPGINHAGLYHFQIEHVGDLTNRMAKSFHVTDQDCGYSYVVKKVKSALRDLTHPYGFEREVKEQLKSNYAYAVEKRELPISFDDFVQQWERAGIRYAKEHAKLVVYNEAQLMARDAAIAIGYKNFNHAIVCLTVLDRHLGSYEDWDAFAGLVRLDVSGNPIPFS